MSGDKSDIWGKPVYVYTRRQGVEDGVLVDLMQNELERIVKENGFKHPVAMTIGAWIECVSDPDGAGPLPDGQDINGRVHDVLWMLRCAIRARPNGPNDPKDRAHFQVRVWDGQRHNLVKLWSLCGPGDSGEPVITIMLEGED